MNRVVITGMGIWSCIGTSLDEVRDALFQGKSGIVLDPARKEAGFCSGLVGNVPKADLKPFLARSARSYMHEESQYAYMATRQALDNAGIDMDYLEQNEVGIIYGNDSAVEASTTAVDKFRQAHNSVACGSGSLFQCMNSTISEDEPQKASRPFDRLRNGLVPSGGAATLVLESYEHAVKRGAKIIAEVIGWGFSGNGEHISTPNFEGPLRCMSNSLKDSGVSFRDIGYINAHATSTLIGDQREAEVISHLFGDYKVPVTSTKSQTGHEMWMAGASELIYSILMMKNDFIAGNINFEEPDEITGRVNILPETRQAHFDTFLSNSFGFGGTNSTLIIKNINS